MTNATLGFIEEMNAQASIAALKDGMIRKLPVKRDGKFTPLNVVEIVPGDVVFLRGGNVVPADSRWMEGDELVMSPRIDLANHDDADGPKRAARLVELLGPVRRADHQHPLRVGRVAAAHALELHEELGFEPPRGLVLVRRPLPAPVRVGTRRGASCAAPGRPRASCSRPRRRRLPDSAGAERLR